MNSLITGAAGFIGHRLVERLLLEGHTLTLLVRHPERIAPSIRDRALVLQADITRAEEVEAAFSKAPRPDIVFHLAACIDFAASAATMRAVNVEGTRHVLSCCRRHKVLRLLFTSSTEAAGPSKAQDPLPDEETSVRPVNGYGRSKADAEAFLLAVNEPSSGTRILIPRLGDVYGPESPSFVTVLARNLRAKDRRWLYDNGSKCLWDPLYISDAVDGILAAAGSQASGVFFLTGAHKPTVGELARIVGRGLRLPEDACRCSAPEKLFLDFFHRCSAAARACLGRPRVERRIYSSEKARRKLGFVARTPLEEGIARTLEQMSGFREQS